MGLKMQNNSTVQNLTNSVRSQEVTMNPNSLVVGGGIAGIQAALDIAGAGHKVYLVEREPWIGGHVMQLSKLFTTLVSPLDAITPKMTAVTRHPNIELMTYSEVEGVSGRVGNFMVKLKQRPRFVDETKCNGCGLCIHKCPQEVDSEFDIGLGKRRAIYIPYSQAIPNIPAIDREHCLYFQNGTCEACKKICEPKAIDFQQADRIAEISVGAVILATGYHLFDPSVMPLYGYKKYDNILTSLEFERICSATGPTGGEILVKNGTPPESVAIIHCVGSRDKNYHEYCSRVCCMYALKYSHLIMEKTNARVYQMYIDMRCFGEGHEEFYNRISEKGASFIRGKVARITEGVAEEEGKLIVYVEDTLLGDMLQVPVDMVILCAAITPRADADKVANLFSISQREDGFFMEKDAKLELVATPIDGIFIAGCCQSPKDISDTVTQAKGAASEVLVLLSQGKGSGDKK